MDHVPHCPYGCGIRWPWLVQDRLCLDWRIVKRADTTVPINGLDQERRMYYSGGGERLLEERIDEDYSGSPGMNRHMAYVWGLRGRYIDDIVCRLVDGNVDGDYLDYAAGTDKIYYHLTDDEFSTVCIVDHTAKVLERVSYDAYGNPRHHRRSDLNGEGSTNIDDQLIVINNWGAPGKGDLDRDGAADIDDLLAVSNDWGAAAPRGRLNYLSTGFDTDNMLGANGTMYNQELSGTPGGGGVNGGSAGGGGGTYSGRGGGNFDSTTGRSSSRAGNPRGAMAMAAGLNGMMGDMGLGSMGISPGTGMCPKSNDSENSPIGDGGPRGRPGPGGDGGEGGGPGPGPGVGPGGGRGPRGGGRTPGWAWGAHDIDPETGKLIAPMEPMPTVRYMGDPASDAIFALNASWGHGRGLLQRGWDAVAGWWEDMKQGWLFTKEYWDEKGPLGKVFFWGTNAIVAAFLGYAGVSIGAAAAGGETLWVGIRVTRSGPHFYHKLASWPAWSVGDSGLGFLVPIRNMAAPALRWAVPVLMPGRVPAPLTDFAGNCIQAILRAIMRGWGLMIVWQAVDLCKEEAWTDMSESSESERPTLRWPLGSRNIWSDVMVPE